MSVTKFTKEHESIRLDGDIGTCGISNYAQEKLGDVVYVELPEVGRRVKQGEEVAVVESVKAASEIYAPASGEIIAVNSALVDQPGLVNQDPNGEGWFFKLRVANSAELDSLMDESAYDAFAADIG
ncbi:MAG: glycine cleavage system protein GcvH [Alphaproteobacteria bacterium]